MKTLFDIDFPSFDRRFHEQTYPYPEVLRTLWHEEADYLDETELSVFTDAVCHEEQYYVPRGQVLGRISFDQMNNNSWTLRTATAPVTIPQWVESDGLRFHDVDVRGLLVTENPSTFRRLASTGDFLDSGFGLVTGIGLPRAGTRRFLHRLNAEFGIPVFLLCDNDTWGYFSFALLKNGLFQPDREFSFLAIQDVAYLGLRAAREVPSNAPTREWRPIWDHRVACMRQYSCFSAPEWQEEFDRFVSQKFSVDLPGVIKSIGVSEFLRRFVLEPINMHQFLE